MAPAPLQPTRTTQLVRSGSPRTCSCHGPHCVLRAHHHPRDRARRAPLAARGGMVRLGDWPRCAVHGRVCRAVCCDELFLVWFIWLGRLCVLFFLFFNSYSLALFFKFFAFSASLEL